MKPLLIFYCIPNYLVIIRITLVISEGANVIGLKFHFMRVLDLDLVILLVLGLEGLCLC